MKIKGNEESFSNHLVDFYNHFEYRRQIEPDLSLRKAATDYTNNEVDMENGMMSFFNYLDEVNKKNQRLMKAIKSVKGKTFFKHLSDFINEAEYSGYAPFEIVDKPVGKLQEVTDYGRSIKKEWVIQNSVGDSGDSWEGTICVELKPKKYLKFHFSM